MAGSHAHDGDILSPMPGQDHRRRGYAGRHGDHKGQKLLTLEAMKMEHTLTAPFDGTGTSCSATPGAQSHGRGAARADRNRPNERRVPRRHRSRFCPRSSRCSPKTRSARSARTRRCRWIRATPAFAAIKSDPQPAADRRGAARCGRRLPAVTFIPGVAFKGAWRGQIERCGSLRLSRGQGSARR